MVQNCVIALCHGIKAVIINFPCVGAIILHIIHSVIKSVIIVNNYYLYT